MKYTNKFMVASVTVMFSLLLSGCAQRYSMAYSDNVSDSTYGIAAQPIETNDKADSFASVLCVTDSSGETAASETPDLYGASAAALFDVNNKKCLFLWTQNKMSVIMDTIRKMRETLCNT